MFSRCRSSNSLHESLWSEVFKTGNKNLSPTEEQTSSRGFKSMIAWSQIPNKNMFGTWLKLETARTATVFWSKFFYCWFMMLIMLIMQIDVYLGCQGSSRCQMAMGRRQDATVLGWAGFFYVPFVFWLLCLLAEFEWIWSNKLKGISIALGLNV